MASYAERRYWRAEQAGADDIADAMTRVLLHALADDTAWQDNALCSQTDPEAFFPEKGGATADAKRVCRSCEVRAECLEYALAHDERFGIWGGMSERQRREIKRRERRAA